jgi:hypothetical protein
MRMTNHTLDDLSNEEIEAVREYLRILRENSNNRIEIKNTKKQKKELVKKTNSSPSRGPRRGVDIQGTNSKYGKTESIKIGPRPNLFESMDEFTAHQEDTVIDKKLNVKKPTIRARRNNLVNMVCGECRQTYSISASIIGADMTWICNECIKRRK